MLPALTFLAAHSPRPLVSLRAFSATSQPHNPSSGTRHQPPAPRAAQAAPHSAPHNPAGRSHGRPFPRREPGHAAEESLQRALATRDVEACLAAAAAGAAPPRFELQAALLRLCLKEGRPDAASRYLRALPRTAPLWHSRGQWAELLRLCARARAPALLEQALALREAAGVPPDAYGYSALISAHGGWRQADALRALAAAWGRPACRGAAVANAAIAACAANADWDAAQRVLDMMRSAGVDPDTITYNSLIKAAGAAGHLPDATRLYGELQQEGLAPSLVTYTALFTAAAQAKHSDADWLFQVYDEMVGSYRLIPNNFVVSSFFSAASYAALRPAHLERVWAEFALHRARCTPSDTVFTSLLMLALRQGVPERAVDVWSAVRQDGVPLTPHLFSALFTVCTAGTSPSLVDVAMEAYHDMHSWDMRWAYNALLHFIGDCGRLEEALAVYHEMGRSGPTPDTVTYNTVIAACSATGDTATATATFRRMLEAGCEPTERTFGALLNVHAKAGDVGAATRLFHSMQAAGIPPNVQAYTCLMDACITHSAPASLVLAFQLLTDMRAAGLEPSGITYGCLLVACERAGDVDRAFQLYTQACAEGVLLTDEGYNVLVRVCAAAGRLDEAVALARSLGRSAGRGSALQAHTLNSLIRALSAAVSLDRALRLLSLMQTLGMRPSRQTYLALVAGCARGGRTAAAWELYRSVRAQAIELDGPAGSALIAALCRSNEVERAEAVYDDMMACAWRRELSTDGPPDPLARRGTLSKRAQVPDGAALGELAKAHASAGALRAAARYYKQLRRDPKAAAAAAAGDRRLWEALVEGYCRQGNVKAALQVFDDWKAAAGRWYAAQAEGGGPAGRAAALARYPRMSHVSLAFLEACCRAEPEHQWRVYDVCAALRQQKERKVEAGLARPSKQSHHVMGTLDEAEAKEGAEARGGASSGGRPAAWSGRPLAPPAEPAG